MDNVKMCENNIKLSFFAIWAYRISFIPILGLFGFPILYFLATVQIGLRRCYGLNLIRKGLKNTLIINILAISVLAYLWYKPHWTEEEGKYGGIAKGYRQISGWFKDGANRIGKWESYDENNVLRCVEYYKNDELHGQKTEWDKNGKKYLQVDYFNGRWNGKLVRWYSNGNKHIEEYYVYSIPHGIEKKWHTNGVLAHEGQWHYRKMIGLWTYWDEDRNKIKEEHYDNDGKLIKLIEYNKIKGIIKYKIETNFKEGKKHGLEKFWNDSGILVCEDIYENGILIKTIIFKSETTKIEIERKKGFIYGKIFELDNKGKVISEKEMSKRDIFDALEEFEYGENEEEEEEEEEEEDEEDYEDEDDKDDEDD